MPRVGPDARGGAGADREEARDFEKELAAILGPHLVCKLEGATKLHFDAMLASAEELFDSAGGHTAAIMDALLEEANRLKRALERASDVSVE